MAPPTYADLGKSARDLFTKGYNFGFLKIDSTTRAGDKSEIEFKTTAAHNLVLVDDIENLKCENQGANKLGGNIDIKYKIPERGITVTEKWNTDNVLGSVIEVNEQLGKGVKLTLDSTFVPATNKHALKLKTDYAHPTARANLDVSLATSPVILASSVFVHQGWLLGLAANFDTATNKLTSSSLAFGRQTGDYTLHSFVNNSTDFGFSLYHRVARNVEVGATAGWKRGANAAATYALAAKYQPSKELVLRGKVDNESRVALAATHSLSDDLKLTLSAQLGIGAAAANADAHKFGLGFEYEPAN